MGGIKGLTTKGRGVEVVSATLSKQANENATPQHNISPATGNLALVKVSTTVTITATRWEHDFAIGNEVYVIGYTNAGNNGRFTLTGYSETTIIFENSDGVNETISSAADLIVVMFIPAKIHLDVTHSSGLPNYASGVTDTDITAAALGGSYGYFSAINTTDVDAIITISGGTLVCPAGATIAHEVKPFTNDASMVASGATSGNVYLNIS